MTVIGAAETRGAAVSTPLACMFLAFTCPEWCVYLIDRLQLYSQGPLR
jgi:hypothetical protein